MKNNMFNFLEVINADGLIEGKDFEVASLFVVDDEMNDYTLEGYFGIESKSFYKKHNIVKDFGKNVDKVLLGHPKHNFTFVGITATPCHVSSGEKWFFYKPKNEIDFDLAIRLGLGVVKMHTGLFSGEYLLYNAWRFEEEENNGEEFLLLKMYVQLKHYNEYDDKLLESFIEKNGDVIDLFLPFGNLENKRKIAEDLKKVFDKKKNNVVEFKKRV